MKDLLIKISKSKLFKIVLNIIAIIYVIFDEFFIYISEKLNTFISKYKIFENINLYLKKTNKYIVLILLLVILSISEVIGIASFVFLSKGIISVFIILYIIKFIPFFVVSYVFKQTKENVLTINWFNYLYTKVISITEYLKHTEVVIKIKELKNNLKEKLKVKKSILKEKFIFLVKKNKK